MGDVESATIKLAELLRHPEDLEKIPGLKAEFNRKKAAVDGQLRHGLRDQLELTQQGMTSITEGQRTVNLIKEEMMKIDKLCAEAQNMIHDFPHINLVAQTHKNFESVEKMRRDIETFEERLENLEYLLAQDDEDPANQPNLLEIHYGLTQLRDIRDEAMAQIKGTEDASTELIDNLALDNGVTVQDLFARLDDVVDWFDKHIGEACINLIELVQAGNDGMVVRLAVVIEEEEKTDKKVKALQDAQREYKDLASRFKSIAAGPKELRGYKDKFIQAIEYVCQANMEDAKEKFNEDPEKIEKFFKWYFNNLNTVKLGMVTLMPKKWKILQTYGNIYHKNMHDLLIGLADDEGLGPQYLLAVINWVDKYYAKMGKLGFSDETLQPHVVDNRAPELIRTYRQVIISAVDQYMDRLNVQDKKNFLDRDETAYDRNADGIFQSKTLGDVWSMLGQNLSVAASSDRSDVAEGVIDAMFAALRSRQRLWEGLIESERDRYASPNASQEGAALLQDWLITIANDQIICIDEENAEIDGRVSFLSSFEKDLAPLVSPAYGDKLEKQLDELRNGYLDLSTKCVEVWSQLMFYTDFRPILAEFFTPTWYSTTGMASITITFSDYLNDYEPVLHPSLRDFLVDNLANELLIQYLSAIRNKGVKIKRSDPFTEKVRDDVIQVFEFFGQYPSGPEVKEKWRAASFFLRLLESEKAAVPAVYEEFKMSYWDVQIGWVEAVLRSRDDFERSMLNAVKAKAAETVVDPGPETIMSRVK